MRREEAEREAAWHNAHDERRKSLEFYAFDASVGLAEDAWDVTMRLRPAPRAPAPVASPAPVAPPEHVAAPEPVAAPPLPQGRPDPWPPPAIAPEATPDLAGGAETVPPAPPAGAAPEAPAPVEAAPQVRRQRLENLRRRVRTTRERMGTAREGMRGARQGMRAAQERARDAQRRMRAAQRRMRAAQRPALRRGRGSDDVGHGTGVAGLGLEPVSRLERLTRLVGTAVIAVGTLWVGMVTALAVLSSATSTLGLLIYAGAVLIGLAAIGLGVVIRRT
jgi:hypothetical protein